MKVHTGKFSTIIILSLLAFVMTSAVCSAQEYSRKGKGEIFGMFQTMGSDTVHETLTGLDLPFEFDSTTVYGLGIGYNSTDHWNVNMDLLFGSTLAEVFTVDADYWLWDINVDYNIMANRLTPLVTAGIGLFNVSSDDTGASETNFSYNIGAGGRWDITDNILVKAVYRITWTEIEDTDESLQFDGVALSVAYMF
jgi:opacity protein-like surface antigen